MTRPASRGVRWRCRTRADVYPPDQVRSATQRSCARGEFYRSGGTLLAEADLYRLCWAGPTLLSKGVLPALRP
ncbi:hypothetical protein [Kitasatospora cheerisanensis]